MVGCPGEGRKKETDGKTAVLGFALGSLQHSNSCSQDRLSKRKPETSSERTSRNRKMFKFSL